MARNFKILVNRDSGILNLELIGDFDSRSAIKVINLMRRDINKSDKVIIDTNSLKNILQFGVDAFHHNLHLLKGYYKNVSFTGENAKGIDPEKRVHRKHFS